MGRIARLPRPGGVPRLRDMIVDCPPAEAGAVVETWLAGAADDPPAVYTGDDFAAHLSHRAQCRPVAVRADAHRRRFAMAVGFAGQVAGRRRRLPLSRQTLTCTAGVIRRHRAQVGSPWRKLGPGQQVLLVLAYLPYASFKQARPEDEKGLRNRQ